MRRDRTTSQETPDYPRLQSQLTAALTGAHACGEPLLLAWIRSAPRGPMSILLGAGNALMEPKADDEIRLLYPPGSSGHRVSGDPIDGLNATFPVWIECVGVHDPVSVRPDHSDGPLLGRLEDLIVQLTSTKFAWVITASPNDAASAQSLMDKAGNDAIASRARADGGIRQKVLADAAESKYREAARGQLLGEWNVRVRVGAESEPDGRRAAALLCSAADLDELPYTLRMGEKDSDDDDPSFPMPSDALATLARPPLREIPGVRVVVPHSFDVTPESSGGISVGRVVDETQEPGIPLTVSPAILNRHTFVSGTTGSGKSQTVRGLLEQITRDSHDGKLEPPVHWLVIEPAKAEYARMAGRLAGVAEVNVIRPGDERTAPLTLNPLEPEPGFSLQTHLDLVRALFLAAFEANEPFPQVLSHALARCYQDLGWDLVRSESRLDGVTPRYPTLGDLQRTALDVVTGIGYGKDVENNVRGFIDVRISSLRLGRPGRFFEGGIPLSMPALLSSNVVIELEDIGDDQDKAFCIGVILIRIIEHLRMQMSKRDSDIPLHHLTVIEEAHRLLKRVAEGTPAAHAVEMFAGLLAEVRAYGEGIVIAEQIPSKIIPDVVKNTALKIVHRLPAADDRQLVGATMNLSEEQSRYIVSLPVGRAAAFVEGMDRPVLTQMLAGNERENAKDACRTPLSLRAPRPEHLWSHCEREGCTLADMAHADELVSDPELIVWIELLVIAHLTGELSPRPERAWLDKLLRRYERQRRRLDCALDRVITSAVDTRYRSIAMWYQPEDLVAHLRERVTASLDGDERRCVNDFHWQAGRFRWIDVERALDQAVQHNEGAHLLTETWRARGLGLDGPTAADQLRALLRESVYRLRYDAVLTGDGQPGGALRVAVGKLSTKDDLAKRFAEATTHVPVTETQPLSWMFPAQAAPEVALP